MPFGLGDKIKNLGGSSGVGGFLGSLGGFGDKLGGLNEKIQEATKNVPIPGLEDKMQVKKIA